ncbi:MAG TPA: DUF4097 family beta strand repeat-containing protein, partial [Candidatus Bathyarchaeia archaeon]|nr:DUF4097 family beta strand repeat-containing protein [Candidatus Bathyarchaeia archaeon]
ARGFGSSTDTITFVESNSSGNIVFEAVFPASQSQFFSASYTVDIHVFEPASYHFYTVQIITVNGDLHVSGISATSVSLTVTNGGITATGITAATLAATDTNGSISLTCASCSAATVLTTNGSITTNLQSVATGGSYLLQSTNGNVNLTLPVAASCTITANTTNGSVSSSGLGVQVTNHAAVTLGTGTATVNLKTTNGSIIVTGQ